MLDVEFDRWVHVMTKGSIIHRHRREELEAAGVDIPDDFIDPPVWTLRDAAKTAFKLAKDKIHGWLFAAQIREREAAYELSVNARRNHIERVRNLQKRLNEHDKTLLDNEHKLAIQALERKSVKRGTCYLPQNYGHKDNVDGEDQGVKEEKERDEGPIRGSKVGNELPPLLYESTDAILREARAIEKRRMDERLKAEFVK